MCGTFFASQHGAPKDKQKMNAPFLKAVERGIIQLRYSAFKPWSLLRVRSSYFRAGCRWHLG